MMRNYSTLPTHALKMALKPNPAKAEQYLKMQNAVKSHAAETAIMWRNVSFFVAFPIIALTVYSVSGIEIEHAHHRKKLRQIPDKNWPIEYDFQNVRSKPYFWGDGDKTLFWNKGINRHLSGPK
ncbi:hypothetical protein TBLA_0D02150 [Henningerozyma blattae CBS 6284]|uniref:Cytochrome c oxidase subunit n=1 Tax=Henningerozyma blattae (strain ATCC 34711 / CBS 6284 / DSM 70876 / NBRC 10599 / NRRL Y-10934 / UCD 77-7) TaxID=1071380 RepID=I2H2W8_HENB6|nr:hypothetical protein TBLA_0D02150 [Tetrapisispora blattae CBS 6284]CCH60720.1 hypothetical protein TBLA_0D02150 [Tetrapisispora blattae CBS 6284]